MAEETGSWSTFPFRGREIMKKINYTHEEIMESTPRTGFFGHPKGLSTLFSSCV
jgi:hypothetical protein